MGQESMQSAQNEVVPVSVEKLNEELDSLVAEKEGYDAVLRNAESTGDEVMKAIFRVSECGAKIEQTRLRIERAGHVDEITRMEEYLPHAAEIMGKRGDSVTTAERREWVSFVKAQRERNANLKDRIAEIDMKLARAVPRNTETQQVEEVA